jgi:predicted transcriptional regulator
VNIGIAAGLFLYLLVSGDLAPLKTLTLTSGSFAERLMAVNLSLALFNLIPAFPMDGGRVLRALLAMRMDYVRATQLSATIGQGIALLFGMVGLFTNAFLVFIALFVWIGASQESSAAQAKDSLSGIPVERAMLADFRTLNQEDTLKRVVELVLSGSQQDFPVIDREGRPIGMLERDAFIAALSRQGENASVTGAMRAGLPEIDSHEMLEAALVRLHDSGAKTLPVTHAGQFIGLITSENITEYLMIRSALRRAKAVSGI